jgi:hypothetical protein
MKGNREYLDYLIAVPKRKSNPTIKIKNAKKLVTQR